MAQSSSQLPVGAQWFKVSPPYPGCIMIYSYHQMWPALNSKPYWSNKQVVPLLGCCSNALGSPGNRLVISGDRTYFQLNFWIQPKLEIFLEKNCCTFTTLRDLKSDHLMHHSYQVWACIAPDSHATAIRQTFFFSKIAEFDRKLSFLSSPDPIFVQRLHYTYVMPRF